MCFCHRSHGEYRETLSALPYLDAFIREVLRLYPPAPTLLRETTANCIIPFGQPVIGRDGSTVWQAILPRRTTVMIRRWTNLSRLSTLTGLIISFHRYQPVARTLGIRRRDIRSRPLSHQNGTDRGEMAATPGYMGTPLDFWWWLSKLYRI